MTMSAVRPDAHFGKASRKAGLVAAAAVSFSLAAASLAARAGVRHPVRTEHALGHT